MILNLEMFGALFALSSALLLAVRILLVRKATVKGDPLIALLASVYIVVIIYLPLTFFFYYPTFGLSTKSFCAFTLAGVFVFIALGFYYSATDKIGASRSDPIKNASLLITTIIALVFLKESVSIGHLIGIFFVTMGIVIIGQEIGNKSPDSKLRDVEVSDFLFPLGTMFFIGLADPLVKLGLSEGTPVTVGISLTYSICLLILVMYSLWKRIPLLRPFRSKERYLYIGAGFAHLIGLTFVFLALDLSRVVVAVPLKNLSPFFVLLLSYIYLRHLEKITKQLVIGTALVVLGASSIGAFM